VPFRMGVIIAPTRTDLVEPHTHREPSMSFLARISLLCGTLLLSPVVDGASADDVLRPRLPGARAVIRAIDHASLQAAIDALPDEGGIVERPPGRFEIDQPPRITGEDVLLRGAGPATHIHNTNTDGQP